MRPWPGSGIHEIQAWVQGQQPNSPEEAAALVEGLQQKSGRPGLQVPAPWPQEVLVPKTEQGEEQEVCPNPFWAPVPGVPTNLMPGDPKVEPGDESKALDLPCAEMEPQALSKAGTVSNPRGEVGTPSQHARQVAPGEGDVPESLLKTDTTKPSAGAASGGLGAWEDSAEALREAEDTPQHATLGATADRGALGGKLEPADCRIDGARPSRIPDDLLPFPLPLPGKRGCWCGECGKTFSQSSYPQQRRRVHTGEKPYMRTECGKAFAWSSNLSQHRRIHTGETPYECPDCEEAFSESSKLAEHLKIHAGARVHACPDCGKVFLRAAGLQQHRHTHSGQKPFACTDYGKRFLESSQLLQHQRTHTGERPFQCAQCGKAFRGTSGLAHHRRAHTGERLLACADRSSSELRQHQRPHSGEKPFVCIHCSKAFVHNSELVSHRRTYTRERLYAYSRCGRAFNHRSNLNKHQKRHAGSAAP